MHYTVIALGLYCLIYLICGIFSIDDLPEPIHIAIAFCCVLWPLAILLGLIIIVLFMLANSWSMIGRQIRSIFVK